MKKEQGFIRVIIVDGGYGFITTENGEERFFHALGAIGDFKDLREGQRVEFMTVPAPKGPKAIGVEVIRNPRLPS